ncbi:B-cell receptor CD22-like [Leptodactylus fuscus]|uniref:B-cell receptor CD22-like n=1 Tax=Leptodactylus fuscus TaxID=238119 RepID=UPI003F4E59AF
MESMKQIYLLLICQGFYLGSVCQRWTFPSTMTALIGSCVEIPCTYHPDGDSGNSSTRWRLPRDTDWYKDRLVHALGENCTLWINPVREGDGGQYIPYISRDLNAHTLQGRSLQLTVTDTVNIDLHVSRTLKEGEAATISCSVIHTCGFRPPSLKWNKPGQVIKKSLNISEGSWREESELTYIPSYVDDGSSVQCNVTYPNGRIFSELGTLNINYSPKNVTVTVIGMDEVIEGTNVTLQCNSFSRPDVHEYEWYKGKTRLPDRGREMTVYNVPGDMEPYSCTAINRVGRGESAPAQIPVLYAPTGVDVIVVNRSVLICDFLSSQPNITHYTWMKDESVLYETGKTLTLEDNEESSGQYSCIAHNRVGNSTSEEICIKF